MDNIDQQDPVEAALADVESEEKSQQVDRIRSRLEALDDHVTMLKAMGINVSITLDAPTVRPLDKIEQPGSVKAPGWYAYVDFMDEEGTKARIDAARLAVQYASRPVGA